MKKLFLIISFFTFTNFIIYSQNTTAPTETKDVQGFSGVTWGTQFSTVLYRYKTLASDPNVKDPVNIVKVIPKKRLIIERNNIQYKFEFYETEFENKYNHTTDAAAQKLEKAPRFFFLESKFILVESTDLYKRLQEKYGKYTKDTVDKKTNRGAYIWDLPGGYIIQWIEPYENKQFTRKIYYISKEIQQKIAKDLNQFQFEKEIGILKNIRP